MKGASGQRHVPVSIPHFFFLLSFAFTLTFAPLREHFARHITSSDQTPFEQNKNLVKKKKTEWGDDSRQDEGDTDLSLLFALPGVQIRDGLVYYTNSCRILERPRDDNRKDNRLPTGVRPACQTPTAVEQTPSHFPGRFLSSSSGACADVTRAFHPKATAAQPATGTALALPSCSQKPDRGRGFVSRMGSPRSRTEIRLSDLGLGERGVIGDLPGTTVDV